MLHENLVKKLIYRSNNRGSKENDKLLSLFATRQLIKYDIQDLNIFQKFLEENDQDIFNWLSEKKDLPTEYHQKIIEDLIIFIKLRNFD